MMSLTTDRNDPGLKQVKPNGQQVSYLVLSEEERAKGFVRPVRRTYRHVGIRPKNPTRELTADEHKHYDPFGYVVFEAYPNGDPCLGRFWTQKQLNSGCDCNTGMGQALAETWARDVSYYGRTFCLNCSDHLPVEEFVWVDDPGTGYPTEERLGT